MRAPGHTRRNAGGSEWIPASEMHRRGVTQPSSSNALDSNPLSKTFRGVQRAKKLTTLKKDVLECRKNQTPVPPPLADESLDAAVIAFLKALSTFQTRLLEENPTKAHAKRRFICGYREVLKFLKTEDVKMVFIASNVELFVKPEEAIQPDSCSATEEFDVAGTELESKMEAWKLEVSRKEDELPTDSSPTGSCPRTTEPHLGETTTKNEFDWKEAEGDVEEVAVESDKRNKLQILVESVESICRKQEVPFVKASTKRKLGKTLKKTSSVSIVGILRPDGAENLWQQILDLWA